MHQTHSKEIRKALTLVNLIPPESSKYKTCNTRKSIFVKEYKPNAK